MDKLDDFGGKTMLEPAEPDNKPDNKLKDGLTRLWNGGDVALIAIAFVFLFIVGSVVAIFSAIDTSKLIEAGGDVMMLEDADNFVLLMASLAASVVAGIGSILLINAFRPKHTLSTLGFRWPERKWFRLAAIIALALLLPRIALVYGLIELFPSLGEGAAALEEAFEMDTMTQTIIVGLVASIVVPIWEEMFFRGFLHNALRNRLSMWPAIIISSFIFAVFHGIAIQAIGAFVLAVGLAWLYDKSDSLWPPIFAHALNNGLAVGLMGIMEYFG